MPEVRIRSGTAVGSSSVPREILSGKGKRLNGGDRERALRQEKKTFISILAGEGPEKEGLLRLIREYGLEKSFELAGFIEDMDVFYRRLDLYINTSFHEGLPLSVLEAMARGIPIVAPLCGGFPEILEDGRHGFLVPGRDTSEFAAKCLLLYEDRELLREMGSSSRERVQERYSVNVMAERYHDVYRGILKESRVG
jgi:glycosyltransferase involved in cell wall biosynthesis